METGSLLLCDSNGKGGDNHERTERIWQSIRRRTGKSV
nr:MAG TPA: hypothetical protein [Caudoviricetes sp.]